MTQNTTQPQPTTSRQPEPVTRIPASLVTTKPPARGLTPPTKRLILAQSTEQLTEALKEVMIELDTPDPTIRKYKKYLQKQTIEPGNMIQTKM